MSRRKPFKLETNRRGVAELNLTDEVKEIVNNHADEIATVAQRSAKVVNGLSWERRDRYSPRGGYRSESDRRAVISVFSGKTGGTSSGVGIARHRVALIAFHPDGKGRKAGRTALRRALRLPTVDAFESVERDRARKKADRDRATKRRRELKAAERARAKRRKAAQRAKDKAVAQRKREALYAQYGGKKQYLAARRKSAAAKRRAEKAAAARAAWIRSRA